MQAELTEIFAPALLHPCDSATFDQRRRAVLLAESISVSEEHRPLLLTGLQEFIDTYRFVEDEQTITAVCGALRKYILNMRPENSVYVAGLLKPTETQSISNFVELTIVKTLYRYLQLFPVQHCGQHPELEQQLFSIISDYAKPRLLQQQNFDAILLNAFMGQILLASPLCKEAAELLSKLSMSWFSELVVRRLDDLAEEISGSKEALIPEVRETIDLLRPILQSCL